MGKDLNGAKSVTRLIKICILSGLRKIPNIFDLANSIHKTNSIDC